MTHARAAASILTPVGLVAAVGVAGWIALRHRADGELSLPRGEMGHAPAVSGFTGAADGWSYRLAPMHADPRRQDFETAALRARFGRASGAPFRLEIHAAEDAPRARIDLATCRIVDAQGTAQDVLQRAEELARDRAAPLDPVRALFAARPAELAPGDSARVVLWGRVPAGVVRLEVDGRVPVVLAPAEWTADPMEDVLARRPAPPEEELGR